MNIVWFNISEKQYESSQKLIIDLSYDPATHYLASISRAQK